MLEKKLLEEVKRFNEINKYGKNLIMEQGAPPPPPPTDEPTDAPPPTGGDAPDAGTPPPTGEDAGAPPTPPAGLDAGAPPSGDTGAPDAGTPPPTNDTEEVDITDLVNMTKSVKDDLEKNKSDNTAVISKMDDVFSKLDDLEKKLSEMNQIVNKIDELGAKIQQMKPETPVEKLEMRSLDSYPFNEKPQEFFDHKQNEMRKSGKNEYILTKNEVEHYPQDIKNTFNPKTEDEVDEYKF